MHEIIKIASPLIEPFIGNPFGTTVKVFFLFSGVVYITVGTGTVLNMADVEGSKLYQLKTSFDSSVKRGIK